MKNNNSVLLVYSALIIKILIYGSSSLFTKRLLQSTDVLDVISLRMLITAIVFIILNLLGIVKLNLKGKNIKTLLLCAFFEPILSFTFETLGFSMSTTIVIGVISALSPISSTIMSRIFLKEKTNFAQSVFVLLGISGVLIIVLFTNKSKDSSEASLLGILFMILSIVSGSLFSVFSRKSSVQFKPIEITCFEAYVGCIGFNSVNIVRHIYMGTISTYFKPFCSIRNIIGFAFLSILCSIVAASLGNFAISKIQLIRISVFSGFTTIYTIVLGIVFNNEVLHWYHIIGTAMILSSVYFVNKFAETKN